MFKQISNQFPAITIPANSNDSTSYWEVGTPSAGRIWAVTLFRFGAGGNAAGEPSSLAAGTALAKAALRLINFPGPTPSALTPGAVDIDAAFVGYVMRNGLSVVFNPPIIVVEGITLAVAARVRNDTAAPVTNTPNCLLQYFDLNASDTEQVVIPNPTTYV